MENKISDDLEKNIDFQNVHLCPLENKFPVLLPDSVTQFLGTFRLFEINGFSNARTFLVENFYSSNRAFLKICPVGTLYIAAEMHRFLYTKGFSPNVLHYHSSDYDYLIIEAAPGTDGTTWLSEPARLAKVFGKALRRFHDLSVYDCTCGEIMSKLIATTQTSTFSQEHLNRLAPFIGVADAQTAASEISKNINLFQCSSIVHGDCCLPNIILSNWEFVGFVDLGDGGIGDPHMDLAMGLWSLSFNLSSSDYGEIFLDAYGRDAIDQQRLRLCGLLSAVDL